MYRMYVCILIINTNKSMCMKLTTEVLTDILVITDTVASDYPKIK